jgi:hypothetical protein
MKDKTHLKAGGLVFEPRAFAAAHAMAGSTRFEPAPFHEGRKYLIHHPGSQGQVPQCAGEMLQRIMEAHDWKLYESMPEGPKYDPAAMYKEAKKFDGMPDVEGTTFDGIVSGAQSLGMIPEHFELKYFNTWKGYQLALHRSYTETCMLGFQITEGYRQASRRTGMIKTGGRYDERLGGHAVVGCTYDEQDTAGSQTAWGDFGWRGLGFVRVPKAWFIKHLMYGASLYDPKRGIYV